MTETELNSINNLPPGSADGFYGVELQQLGGG